VGKSFLQSAIEGRVRRFAHHGAAETDLVPARFHVYSSVGLLPSPSVYRA